MPPTSPIHYGPPSRSFKVQTHLLSEYTLFRVAPTSTRAGVSRDRNADTSLPSISRYSSRNHEKVKIDDGAYPRYKHHKSFPGVPPERLQRKPTHKQKSNECQTRSLLTGKTTYCQTCHSPTTRRENENIHLRCLADLSSLRWNTDYRVRKDDGRISARPGCYRLRALPGSRRRSPRFEINSLNKGALDSA